MVDWFGTSEYDTKTAIPKWQFEKVLSLWRPSVTDPGKISVGDPYIEFEDKSVSKHQSKQNRFKYTRNFNHSEIVPKKEPIHKLTAWYFNQGKKFIMPLMEKIKEGQGKVIGYIKGQVQRDISTGGNILRINDIEITHGDSYRDTFATGKEKQGLKTNIGRNILTQVIQKLPFIDQIEGARISGARKIAEEGKTGNLRRDHRVATQDAVLKPSVISRIKNSLAGNGLIEGFFTQSKLSPENVKEWLTKNNRAVAGVAMSGNDPMQSLGIKSMGSATDDPANFYLKMAEGGFIEGDEFSDMIEFVPSAMMHGGGMADINYLTRRL